MRLRAQSHAHSRAPASSGAADPTRNRRLLQRPLRPTGPTDLTGLHKSPHENTGSRPEDPPRHIHRGSGFQATRVGCASERSGLCSRSWLHGEVSSSGKDPEAFLKELV